jgi:hypothetical protein
MIEQPASRIHNEPTSVLRPLAKLPAEASFRVIADGSVKSRKTNLWHSKFPSEDSTEYGDATPLLISAVPRTK